MANTEYSEQELLRRESLIKLRELGIEPYPAPLYPVNASAKMIADEYDDEKKNLQDLCIAGRIMSRRIMGAASFMELQDERGTKSAPERTRPCTIPCSRSFWT